MVTASTAGTSPAAVAAAAAAAAAAATATAAAAAAGSDHTVHNVLAARTQFWQASLPQQQQQQVQPHNLQLAELQQQEQLELGSTDVLDAVEWDDLMAAVGLLQESDCEPYNLEGSSMLAAAPISAWPAAAAAAAAADADADAAGASACSVAQEGKLELLQLSASTVTGTVIMQHPSPAAVQRWQQQQQQQQQMAQPGLAPSPLACMQLMQPAAQGAVMGLHPWLTPSTPPVVSSHASLAQGQQLAGPPLLGASLAQGPQVAGPPVLGVSTSALPSAQASLAQGRQLAGLQLVKVGSTALLSPVAGSMVPALWLGSVPGADCARDAAAAAAGACVEAPVAAAAAAKDGAVAAGLLVGVRTLEQALAFCGHTLACLGDLAQHLQQHFGSSSSGGSSNGSSSRSAAGVIGEWLQAGWYMEVLRCGDLVLSAGPGAISEAVKAAKAQPVELASPGRLALLLMSQLLLLICDVLSLHGLDAGAQQQGRAAVFVWEVLKQLQQGVEATQITLSGSEPFASHSGGGGGCESGGGSYGVMCRQLLHSYAAAQFGGSQVCSLSAAAGCTVLNLVQLL
jgi:hypothetical protein